MQFKKLIGAAVVAGLVGQTAIMSQVANAGSHSDFYKGKTITIVVRSGPGGGYDTYGRLVGLCIQYNTRSSYGLIGFLSLV